MFRFLISLEPVEAKALSKWAASEMRDPRDQIRFILRMELERRGLLPAQAIGPLQLSDQTGGTRDEPL